MKDEFIICIQCENEFVFSVEEQSRYAKMNFDEPKRCPVCRKKRSHISGSDENQYRNKKKHYRFKYEQ